MAYVPYVWGAGDILTIARMNNLESQYTEVGNLFDAHSILIAIADNTPVVLPLAASRIVGRAAAGNIVALTGAEVLTIIGRIGKSNLEWTNAKLLLGAGAGADPTEIDVPTITKEFFIPIKETHGTVDPNQQGFFAGNELNAGAEHCYFAPFKIPADFTAVTHLTVMVIKRLNGNVDWTLDTNFAAVGEAKDTHTDQATADGVAMVDTLLYELDASAALGGVAVGDWVGAKLVLDVISAGGILVCGMTFKYS